jgi:hypothetical protein
VPRDSSLTASLDWARRFDVSVKRALGEATYQQASMKDDMERGTDFVLYTTGKSRIAARVRESYYWRKGLGADITIRRDRPSGSDTEIHRVMEGWVDLIFYGFAADEESTGELTSWWLIDTIPLRSWYHKQIERYGRGVFNYSVHYNYDGSSSFYAWNVYGLPEKCIYASSGAPRQKMAIVLSATQDTDDRGRRLNLVFWTPNDGGNSYRMLISTDNPLCANLLSGCHNVSELQNKKVTAFIQGSNAVWLKRQ